MKCHFIDGTMYLTIYPSIYRISGQEYFMITWSSNGWSIRYDFIRRWLGQGWKPLIWPAVHQLQQVGCLRFWFSFSTISTILRNRSTINKTTTVIANSKLSPGKIEVGVIPDSLEESTIKEWRRGNDNRLHPIVREPNTGKDSFVVLIKHLKLLQSKHGLPYNLLFSVKQLSTTCLFNETCSRNALEYSLLRSLIGPGSSDNSHHWRINFQRGLFHREAVTYARCSAPFI